jgi:hypothetical protein
MSHRDQDSHRSSRRPVQDLAQAMDWLLQGAAFGTIRFRRDCGWAVRGLVMTALFWAWSARTTLGGTVRPGAGNLPADRRPQRAQTGLLSSIHETAGPLDDAAAMGTGVGLAVSDAARVPSTFLHGGVSRSGSRWQQDRIAQNRVP